MFDSIVLRSVFVAVWATAVLPSGAFGALQTYLTIANAGSGLPSNQFAYVSVKITATGTLYSDSNGSYYKSVRFAVDPISQDEHLLYPDVPESPLEMESNFGLQKFAFNYTGDPTKVTLTDFLPAVWKVKVNASYSLSEFGRFEIIASGNGGTRANPLEFTAITTEKLYGNSAAAAAAAIENAFKTNNASASQGSTYNFAAHVGGFSTEINNDTSAWFADGEIFLPGPSLPEPASLAIWGATLAIAGLGSGRLRKMSTKVVRPA